MMMPYLMLQRGLDGHEQFIAATHSIDEAIAWVAAMPTNLIYELHEDGTPKRRVVHNGTIHLYQLAFEVVE